jgi:hypothetical protein
MTFDDILAQIMEILQRQGRVGGIQGRKVPAIAR